MRITEKNLQTIFQNYVMKVLNGKLGYLSGAYYLEENCNKWGIMQGTSIIYPIAYSKKELYNMLHFALSMHYHKEREQTL